MSGVPDLRTLAARGPVHFMGIGGAGMCALAELVLRSGGRVSGCDLKESDALRDLARLGADIHVGHDAAHVAGASALVITSAVPQAHAELAAAHAGLGVHEYAAKQVKRAVTGTGGAAKEQVAMMVRFLLPGCGEVTADAADALAVAICHAHFRAGRAKIAAQFARNAGFFP